MTFSQKGLSVNESTTRVSLGNAVVAVVVTAVSLALPGCGSVTDRLAEEAVEEATGVEVDADGETVTLEGPDGSIVVDGDGETVTIEGSNGDGGERVSISANGELPDGFDLPIPDGGLLVSTSTVDSDGRSASQVFLEFPADDLERVASFYDEHFEGVEGVNRIDASGEDGRALSFTGESLVVTVSGDGDQAVVFLQSQGDG